MCDVIEIGPEHTFANYYFFICNTESLAHEEAPGGLTRSYVASALCNMQCAICCNVQYVCVCTTVGYTMRDIRYKWNEGPNSVGVSNEVSLPQFKVLGHRQRAMEISLTTGTVYCLAFHSSFILYWPPLEARVMVEVYVESITDASDNTKTDY
jgi:hypothetical protein